MPCCWGWTDLCLVGFIRIVQVIALTAVPVLCCEQELVKANWSEKKTCYKTSSEVQPDFSDPCKISTVTFVAGMVPDLFCCPALGINSVFIRTPDVHGLLRVFEGFSGMQNEVLHELIAGKLQK